jgi:hypothetical protein
MSNWPRLVNPRRCARAVAIDTGEATNTTVALLNNSPAPDLLIVWQIYGTQSGNALQTAYQQGLAPLANPYPIQPIVPDEAVPPGVVTSGDFANPIVPDQVLDIGGLSIYWPATFPFAVLKPGWSLVVQGFGGGMPGLTCSFFWEAIHPELFDHIYMGPTIEEILALQSR